VGNDDEPRFDFALQRRMIGSAAYQSAHARGTRANKLHESLYRDRADERSDRAGQPAIDTAGPMAGARAECASDTKRTSRVTAPGSRLYRVHERFFAASNSLMQSAAHRLDMALNQKLSETLVVLTRSLRL